MKNDNMNREIGKKLFLAQFWFTVYRTEKYKCTLIEAENNKAAISLAREHFKSIKACGWILNELDVSEPIIDVKLPQTPPHENL